jgi:hypothetical protein
LTYNANDDDGRHCPRDENASKHGDLLRMTLDAAAFYGQCAFDSCAAVGD